VGRTPRGDEPVVPGLRSNRTRSSRRGSQNNNKIYRHRLVPSRPPLRRLAGRLRYYYDVLIKIIQPEDKHRARIEMHTTVSQLQPAYSGAARRPTVGCRLLQLVPNNNYFVFKSKFESWFVNAQIGIAKWWHCRDTPQNVGPLLYFSVHPKCII